MDLQLQITQTDADGKAIDTQSIEIPSGETLSLDFSQGINLSRDGELPARVAPVGDDIVVQWQDGAYVILEDAGAEAAVEGEEPREVSINGVLISSVGNELDRSDLGQYMQWTADYEDSPLPWEPLPPYQVPWPEFETDRLDVEEEEEPVPAAPVPEGPAPKAPPTPVTPPTKEPPTVTPPTVTTPPGTLPPVTPPENQPPVIGPGEARVSDEGLPGGLEDDDPNAVLDQTDEATFTGSLTVSDPDGDPVTITLTAPDPDPTVALKSGGTAIKWTGGGTNTLTGSANGVPVVTITIDNSGNYTVTILGPLDHPDDTTEDIIRFTVGVTVSDGQATVETTLDVAVEDDMPVVTDEFDSGIVDEDALPGGIEGGPGDIDAGAGTAITVATGNVSALFLPGADQPLTYSLSTTTTGLPPLTSGGTAITYSVVGNTLTASTPAGTVFTFTLDGATGAWNFTLSDQLDHAVAGTEDDIVIQLGSLIVATDADGDSVNANAGVLFVTVDDDSPTLAEAISSGIVDEDALPGGIEGGPGDIDAGAGTATTVATGNVSALFQSGADRPLTYSLSTATTGLPALTSNGTAVNYSVVGNTLTASTPAGTVFTFTLDAATGAWNFTLGDQLDHAVAGTEDDIVIQLGSLIVATDADGDPVNANAGALVVTVDDDSPTLAEAISSGIVDEDGLLPEGIPGGPEDVEGEAIVDTGNVSVLFDSGADQPLTYSLSTTTTGLPALTSDGATVSYAVSGNTLTASTTAGTVFTFTLDAATGDWTFNLKAPLDHPTLTGQPGDDTENDIVLALGSLVTATDADGDSVKAAAGALLVTVDDDSPIDISPEDATLDNLVGASVTGALDTDRNIDDNVGADQLGAIRFANVANGEDSGLDSGGENILLYVSADGQTLTGATGSDADTGKVFTIELNPDANFGAADDIYTIEMQGTIDNPNGGGTTGPIEFAIEEFTGNDTRVDLTLAQVTGGVEVTVNVDEFVSPGDITGVFFDLLNDDVGGVSVTGSNPTIDSTDVVIDPNQVINLGGGVNLVGEGTVPFDVGVRVGDSGATDFYDTITFTIHGVTLDDLAGQRFGVRLMSVGGTPDDPGGEGSSKLAGGIPDDGGFSVTSSFDVILEDADGDQTAAATFDVTWNSVSDDSGDSTGDGDSGANLTASGLVDQKSVEPLLPESEPEEPAEGEPEPAAEEPADVGAPADTGSGVADTDFAEATVDPEDTDTPPAI